ncbi:hypothetical protein EAE96_002676 [Botrytis aclada]|nr:hypothetical protein EAE96_002676 [Botrytis aclada]
MRGGMSESQVGCTVWDDVGKETFERFAQFAYTGDYTVPFPVHKMRELSRSDDSEELNLISRKERKKEALTNQKEPFSPSPLLEVLQAQNQEISNMTSRLNEFLSSRQPRYTADFTDLIFPAPALRNNYEKTCESNEQFNPEKSYSNVFISHAALSILGDFRLVDSLKALALYKLHKALCVFQLSSKNTEDVIDLARYVYSEEGGEECHGEIGVLRGLVCHYMAVNAFIFSHDDGFMELLGEGGKFVKDFFKFNMRRVAK